MNLSPAETDRLLLHLAALLAGARRARGLRLNVPEATALVADAVCEAARDGADVAQAAAAGAAVLGPGDVLPGVAALLPTVHVEAGFDDGTRLVTVVDPVGGARPADPSAEGWPGEVLPGALRGPDGDHAHVVASLGPDVVTLEVTNTGTVPVTLTSHLHLAEANPHLALDRGAAYGRRLAVPAGGVVTVPAGATVRVGAVPVGGLRVVVGAAGAVDGPLDAPGAREEALARLRGWGYRDTGAAGRTGGAG